MIQSYVAPGFENVFNLSELENSGIGHFYFLPEDVIEFEKIPRLKLYKREVTHGRPLFFIECIINGVPRILPISMFRKASCTDYVHWIAGPKMRINRILHELPNDRAFVEFVQGKTLKVTDVIEGDRPLFEFGEFGSRIMRDENGNIVTQKAMYPVFEII